MTRNEAATKYRALRSKSLMDKAAPAKFDERCAKRVTDAKDFGSWVLAAKAVLKAEDDYIRSMSQGTRGRR
jgi:hypothetical protein